MHLKAFFLILQLNLKCNNNFAEQERQAFRFFLLLQNVCIFTSLCSVFSAFHFPNEKFPTSSERICPHHFPFSCWSFVLQMPTSAELLSLKSLFCTTFLNVYEAWLWSMFSNPPFFLRMLSSESAD